MGGLGFLKKLKTDRVRMWTAKNCVIKKTSLKYKYNRVVTTGQSEKEKS